MSDRAEADQEMSVRRVRWPLVDIKIQILFISSCRTERSLQASGDLAGSNSAATANWEMQEIGDSAFAKSSDESGEYDASMSAEELSVPGLGSEDVKKNRSRIERVLQTKSPRVECVLERRSCPRTI
jgi:hypothetical protein